jgi:prepilin peptidase CpaA
MTTATTTLADAGGFPAAVFLALLVAACVTDVRERRIPNRLVAVLLAAGVAHTLAATPDVGALGRALAAGALGFAIWIPFYALRMLGAGDVKLFAAASVWLTPALVLRAALYASLFGGALSLVWILLEYGAAYGMVRLTFLTHQPIATLRAGRVGGDARRHIPYGIAMALGLSLAVWLSRAP